VEGDSRGPKGLRLLLLGAPGSGKGTQASALSSRLCVPAISTGEMLREAVAEGSELGERISGLLASGELVDDATMRQVVQRRLDKPDTERGFMLDGYPRTIDQAHALDEILSSSGEGLDAAIQIEVPEEELVRRALARRREDDREDIVRRRLAVYRDKTRPVAEFYRDRGLLVEVDGDQPIVRVTEAILSALGVAA
ncbi:MAG TPA: adenylate kinase, partial [Thermoanaerobaculia bacterium]|nr:adenylate kinase [Thermoanaerobaculia bacterium]